MKMVALWTSMPMNNLLVCFMPFPPTYRRTDRCKDGSRTDIQTQEGLVAFPGAEQELPSVGPLEEDYTITSFITYFRDRGHLRAC
jgi:hypothetical protein